MENIISKRLLKIGKKLDERGIDAILITKRENYFYLSGFRGSFAYLLITKEKTILITDFRYILQAKTEAPLYEVIEYKKDCIETLNDILLQNNIKNLGFEDDFLTYKGYKNLEAKLTVKDFVPLAGLVEELRLIKDREEIEIIKKAVDIADRAFSHILKFIKPGIKEIEVAAELEYYMKKQGATAVSFETIIASGVRASMPHGVASQKVIEYGDVVTLDYGALFKEYCSDMTRTVFVGEPKDELKDIYKIVKKAQIAALEGIISGITGKDADDLARSIIKESGFGECFGHGLGHGVGIEVHESPRLSPKGEMNITEGMVFTIEPGIYIENLGGVRIEDMAIIQDGKLMILTKSTKDLIVI